MSKHLGFQGSMIYVGGMIISIIIYIYEYVCMGVCICSWMGGQGGESYLFEVGARCPEYLSLSTLGAKTTQKAVPSKTCETRREGWREESVRGETSKRSVQSRKAVSLEHGVKTQSNEDDRQMSQHFGSCVGLSQSSHISQNKLHTQMLKSVRLHLSEFCSSKSVFVLFLPSTICLFVWFSFFLYNLWNAHTARCEKKQDPHH